MDIVFRFKKGDRVKCINNYHNIFPLTVGKRYIVHLVTNGTNEIISIIDDSGSFRWYAADIFDIDLEYIRNKNINEILE